MRKTKEPEAGVRSQNENLLTGSLAAAPDFLLRCFVRYSAEMTETLNWAVMSA